MPRQRKTSLVGVKLGKLVTKSGDAFTVKTVAAGLSAVAIDWIPDRRVLRSVPPDFCLPLQLVTGDDGLRRVVPRCDAREFLIRAASGGLAVMQRVRTLKEDDRKTYCLMSLLFQWSFSDRRLMSRTIWRSEDLSLRQSERGSAADRDVLPDIEIVAPSGKTKRLTPDDLLSRGQQSACERGIPATTVSQQIHLGLLEMAHCSTAQTNGFHRQDSDQIIRFSLFGLEQGERTDDAELKAIVEERLILSVKKHLDLSAVKFRRWMWKDFDNIVQQLAQRKYKQSGPVSRQQVRYLLFDLLWRSFGYVSGCVRLQMQAVRQAIHPPLTDQERHVFGLWYDRQPWTAGLAPIVLHNRLGLLLPTLADLEDLDDPDDDGPWRALLQALLWSNEMVENRRKADCVQKHGVSITSESGLDMDEVVDEDRDLTGDQANDGHDDWTPRPGRRSPGRSRR